ncbi:MAG: DUF4252 domain-containing protein [Parabacteroides sp.]
MRKMKWIFVAMLCIAQMSYGQSIEQLFTSFKNKEGANTVHVGGFIMKMASLFTETMGVKSVDVLELAGCTTETKQNFEQAIAHFNDPAFETVITSNETSGRMKVLFKIEEDRIREIVLYTTGNDCNLIHIKGNINPADIEKVVEENKK